MSGGGTHNSVRRAFLGGYLSIFITALVGIVLASASFYLLRSWEYEHMRTDFEHLAANQARAVERAGDDTFRILRSVMTFFKSSRVVERAEFDEFTRPLADMPGIQAIEWIPRVAHARRQGFEERMRAELGGDFIIKEYDESGPILAADRQEYFPICYVQRLAGIEAYLGFDLASEPVRRRAMEAARDTGKMVATGKVALFQDDQAAGVLIFQPVYRSGMPTGTVQQRRANLEGFILGVFRVADLLSAALDVVEARGTVVELWDVKPDGDKQLLYRFLKDSPDAYIDTANIAADLLELRYSVTFNAASRVWAVDSTPTADFRKRYLTFWPWGTLVIILIITGLVSLAFYMHINQAQMIEQEVVRRTEQLRASETRFRAIFDQTFEFMGLLKPDGTLLEANRTALEFAGLEESDVIGKLFWETPWWGHSDTLKDGMEDAVGKAAAGEFVRFEVYNYNAAGEMVDVDFSIKPVYDGKGDVCLLIPEGREISARKQAEREREELLRAVEAKNKELQSIVYVASHDLKSPLVNLEGFSGELEKDCAELEKLVADAKMPGDKKERFDVIVSEYIPESLNFIRRSAAKMGVLLEGLLRISRLGSVELDIVEIDMNDLVRGVLNTMEYRIKQNDVSVDVGDLPKCAGDKDQIHQVFANLIDNALKYLDPDRQGEISITGEVEGGFSVYCVRDNGIGIDREHARKVFELFHRLNPDNAEGEGLGLTIVTRILDRNGGRIHVESASGQGASFFVSLPTA